jgi:hypothetical protein
MEVSRGRPQEAQRPQRVARAVALLICVMGLAGPAASQTATGTQKSSKAPTILFMCPHGRRRVCWRSPISSVWQKSVA